MTTDRDAYARTLRQSVALERQQPAHAVAATRRWRGLGGGRFSERERPVAGLVGYVPVVRGARERWRVRECV